jgi:S-adenosylmethionine-diacylgycerolhomoserine-N-methlytransferase
MKLFADLPVLWHLIFPSWKGETHQERLDAFYRGQARTYDDFRRRLLHGREDLMALLDFPKDGLWLDMGAGTGSNAELLGDRLVQLRRTVLVDLCPALHEEAQRRIRERGWSHVEATLADSTTYGPDEAADVVTFSYSLTMTPDWFRAVDQAWENLKPGGLVGIVDFYISRKHPEPGVRRHSRFQRFWWPKSYSWDNVFLSPDLVPYLRHRFQEIRLDERLGRVPYYLGLKSPYFLFVGRKQESPRQGIC